MHDDIFRCSSVTAISRGSPGLKLPARDSTGRIAGLMINGLDKLTLLAVAAGCGSSSAPAVLGGPLAFPIAVVYVSTYGQIGEGAPDGGWPAININLQTPCYINDGFNLGLKQLMLDIWNPDGGPIVTGTWPFIDANADPSSGGATIFYRANPGGSGVGGSVTLTAAGPAYVGSFFTTINGQRLSGTFSSVAPNQCACTKLPGGGTECPD